jgi:hypothetical protein
MVKRGYLLNNLATVLLILILSYSWQIRIGDKNHADGNDDTNLKVLNISNIYKHPDYDGEKVYHDIAILKTEKLEFSRAIKPGICPSVRLYVCPSVRLSVC